MKKFLLPLLTVLVIFTSCEKEDDLFTPVNPPNTNTNMNNTDTTTINNSKYSGEYTRNPDANGEDVLISYFKDGTLDLSINKYFNFKLYGPPRPIYMSFQDAINNEIHAFNSFITNNNQWQQFSVDLSNVALQNSNITRFVLFLDQGIVNWDMYYLDDFNLSSLPLSVNNKTDSDLISIYPQPAQDYIHFNYKLDKDEIHNLYLYDIQGNKISSTAGNNSNNVTLDVSNLNSGIYFVKIHSKDDSHTYRIQIIK